MTHIQTEILSLLDDCARMTRESYPAVSVACLQLHHGVVPFLPHESRLSLVYGPKSRTGIEVKEGQEQTWSPCVRVLEGHSGECNSVAFSPDGGRLVSGSEDETVRLWNVQTGALLQVMTGHTSSIFLVASSPDG